MLIDCSLAFMSSRSVSPLKSYLAVSSIVQLICRRMKTFGSGKASWNIMLGPAALKIDNVWILKYGSGCIQTNLLMIL